MARTPKPKDSLRDGHEEKPQVFAAKTGTGRTGSWKKLIDNASAVIKSISRAKPASSKGRYLKKVTVSSTMGPGVKLDIAKLKIA